MYHSHCRSFKQTYIQFMLPLKSTEWNLIHSYYLVPFFGPVARWSNTSPVFVDFFSLDYRYVKLDSRFHGEEDVQDVEIVKTFFWLHWSSYITNKCNKGIVGALSLKPLMSVIGGQISLYNFIVNIIEVFHPSKLS